MKRTNVVSQTDLFNGVPAPPTLTSLQHNHGQLVTLLSRLLWEVIVTTRPQTIAENAHEQDQP
jgi:hypothetical protein